MASCDEFQPQSVFLREPEMRRRRSRSYPSIPTGAGLPVPTPDGRGPGRERVVVPPDARSRPSPGRTLIVGDFSSGCRALLGRPILCGPDEPFAHSSLVRHLASTRTPSLLPPILDCPVEAFCCRGPLLRPSLLVGRHSRKSLGAETIVDHFDGAPIDTGRTGEPEAPCARSGKIMVHDSQTLSLASSPRRAF